MAVCENCWAEATRRSLTDRREVALIYHEVLREAEESPELTAWHPHTGAPGNSLDTLEPEPDRNR